MNDSDQTRAYTLAVAACLIVALTCHCPSPAFAAASQADHCTGHAGGDAPQPEGSVNCCVDYVADVRPFSNFGVAMPDGPDALPAFAPTAPETGIPSADPVPNSTPRRALPPPVFVLNRSLLI